MGLEQIDWGKIITENVPPQLVDINVSAIRLGMSLV
jgi:hypothetical protein